MRLTRLVIDKIKRILGPFYNPLRSIPLYKIYKNITHNPKSKIELHDYWKAPWDGDNLPETYLEGAERSEFLLGILKRYGAQDFKILEIGCNVGRNLHHLFISDFRNLKAIEISENAVQVLKQNFPEMANNIEIYNTAVENIIKKFKTNQFNLIYTMAVLEHIHNDSSWIFSEIARITNNFLITIEDETHSTWRHFPRNYKKIFESFGMEQVEEINCEDIKNLGKAYNARIFKKRTI